MSSVNAIAYSYTESTAVTAGDFDSNFGVNFDLCCCDCLLQTQKAVSIGSARMAQASFQYFPYTIQPVIQLFTVKVCHFQLVYIYIYIYISITVSYRYDSGFASSAREAKPSTVKLSLIAVVYFDGPTTHASASIHFYSQSHELIGYCESV